MPGAEWLEADGLGGFACGPMTGPRFRRYHALLLVALDPPAPRTVLVNGYEAFVRTEVGRYALTVQRYAPGVTAPGAPAALIDFRWEPWPSWTYRLPDGVDIVHEIVVRHGSPVVTLSWRLVRPRAGIALEVRPLMSGRDMHRLHCENALFDFTARCTDGRVTWRPYEGTPAIVSLANGIYEHDPVWYRQVRYDEEAQRGYDADEDLAAPGRIVWDLSVGDAAWILGVDCPQADPYLSAWPPDAITTLGQIRGAEQERRSIEGSPLARAADAYVVRRGGHTNIVAGYPWFGHWTRDTLVSMRGLLLATARLDDARDLLLHLAEQLSEGMLPNREPDGSGVTEYNAVDASLWYAVAVHDYCAAVARRREVVPRPAREILRATVETILGGYTRGTRYGIRVDDDGLVAAGEPGVQLTWMDARVGDRVVTPRVGKPVEVQALWINALRIAGEWTDRWRPTLDLAERSFRHRFWSDERGYLADVVDVDHERGRVDATLRPNQLFAVGGLPYALLDQADTQRVVDIVERLLWTPLGPRSLAAGDPAYRARYTGGVASRDEAYHQGTVWPWLTGAFVEAWARARGMTGAACREAHARFVAPMLAHLADAGLGHVSEVADADPPHQPGGCPFQAWSVAELLRLERTLLSWRSEEVP